MVLSLSTCRPVRCALYAIVASGTFLLASCSDPDVLAKVGSTKVRRAELETFVASKSRAKERDLKSELDELVSRWLLAEGARQEGLHKNSQVRARIAAAEREVLAKALLEKRLASATDEAALRERYRLRKDGLSRREIHVRHIVVRLAQPDDTEARRVAQGRVNELYAKLVGGADFVELAREYSDDSATAQKGGDLGTLREGEVDQAFFDAAASLAKGQRAEPFASPFGLHLVEAMEDPRTVTVSFEEARGKLAAEARFEAETKLVDALRRQVSVELRLENLAGDKP
ncbi:MAG TPA: hypothetical protein DFS52_03535 [Myxococcales bacterium]|jgi:parvulin-like peptidyl-prolyl isomerase|nr:hypothetical protein [Myxococcales bacterium]